MKGKESGLLRLLIFILSCCGIGIVSSSSVDIVELTEKNFEDQFRNKSLLVMFYDPGCESCDVWSNLLSDFGQIMKKSGMIDVSIGTAECTPDKGLCEAKKEVFATGCYRLSSDECCNFIDGRENTPYNKETCVVVERGTSQWCEPLCFATNQCTTRFTGKITNRCSSKEDYRFKMNLKDPKLKFFKSSNSSVDYVGPKTILGLRSFINEQTGRAPTRLKTKSELVLEAGCKRKEWTKGDDTQGGSAGSYKWVGSGHLLQKGVCIEESYQKFFAPEQGKTIVQCEIEYQKVRKVDAKGQTLSIDLVMNLKWHDPNIRINFTTDDKKNEGVALRKEATAKIWIPDLYIWNSTTLKSNEEWAFLKRSQIYSIKNVIDQVSAHAKTIVEMKYEIKTTVYCDFQFVQFPMDVQNCSLRIGSGSEGAIFLLKDDVNKDLHSSTSYKAVGLNMEITFFGSENRFRNSTVGFHIEMNRLIYPFLMKYYVPCIAIVFVSELGFVIPLTAIPGRVALLVTQFLTLVNLFIHQMSESPTSSEMTILGTYILVSLAFVAFAMVEFAFIITLNRRAKMHQSEHKIAEMYPMDNGAYKDDRLCVGAPPIHIIDITAFFMHFVAYLIFNICYWNQYGQ